MPIPDNPARNILSMYTIYDSPKDYPNEFVVRRWIMGAGTVTEDRNIFLRKRTLEEVRENLARLGLYNLGRETDDDVNIVETWV